MAQPYRSVFTERFGPWLVQQPDIASDVARQFFELASVVLDANVLLDLYRFTKEGREQVLSVLEMIGQARLWLPHQIGLEFARNRDKAVSGRISSLHIASKTLAARFENVSRLVREARDDVADLVREMMQDDAAADAIVEAIPNQKVLNVVTEWQNLLTGKLKELKAAEAVTPKLVASNDPLLPRIEKLYGAAVGQPFSEIMMRQLVEQATNYRYPNKIPPGFSDTGKETDLRAAGDYIAWEQILTHAGSLPEPRYLIFVSGDTKGDWYELDPNGRPLRPWPALHAEMRLRANAEVLILTPRDFLQGAQQFLGAPVDQETYEEVDRVAAHAAAEQRLQEAARTRAAASWSDGSSRPDDAISPLQRRLRRVLHERESLASQLDELASDPNGRAELDDPRSFASALAARVETLNQQVTDIEMRIRTHEFDVD